MNRIEQVTVPTPAQQPQPRLPRPLAGIRRRAAGAMAQPAEAPSRARRGTSRLAVALATLAVPLLPSQALGAAPSHGTGAARPEAPHTWHHLRHPGQMDRGSGMTFQAWELSGWTLTIAGRPEGLGLPGDPPGPRPAGYYRPWFVEPALPVVLPDGKRESAGRRASSTSPRADAFRASRRARSRVVSDPLLLDRSPADTRQMTVGTPQEAADVPRSPCLRETYPAATDGYMVARLRPVTDPMNVVVTHERTPCATRVDYLSQARA